MSNQGIREDDGTFHQPTFEEIENRIETQARDRLGENVDLSQGSPVKQLLDTVIFEHEYTWQLLEDVYYSAYYGHAYESQLDKLLELAQYTRLSRRGARGEVTFRTTVANDTDVEIPEGTRVATAETDDRPPIPFKTTEPARLPAGAREVTNVGIRACEPWEADLGPDWLGAETNVAAGTVTSFQTNITGIDEVTNPYPTGDTDRELAYSFREGRDRETDSEFRTRFEREIGSQASATIDAIRTNVQQMNGVRNAGVEENVTMDDNTDDGGLPPKSVRLTVLGDVPDDAVAQTLVETRAGGIRTYGDVSGVGVTTDGVERTQYFRYAEPVDIYVDVEVTHDASYPDDGNLRVENSVIEYVGGETAAGDDLPGTPMGEDVIYDLLHNAAMSVRGVWQVDVFVATSQSPDVQDDIAVGQLESAITHHDDVNVFNTESSRP